jgi:hypothetical protein
MIPSIDKYSRRLAIAYSKSGLVGVKNVLGRVGILDEEIGKSGKVGVYNRIVQSVEPAYVDLSSPDYRYYRVSTAEPIEPPFTERRVGRRDGGERKAAGADFFSKFAS